MASSQTGEPYRRGLARLLPPLPHRRLERLGKRSRFVLFTLVTQR